MKTDKAHIFPESAFGEDMTDTKPIRKQLEMKTDKAHLFPESAFGEDMTDTKPIVQTKETRLHATDV